MKAVISDRIYLKVTSDYREELRSILKYTLNNYAAGRKKPEVIQNCDVVSTDIVSIPSGRLDLVPTDYEIVDKRCKAPAVFPKFKFTLRESQQKIHDAVDSSCLINADPSWGKTFTGIAIAAKLGVKTLVVTHTVGLRTQWANEIEKTLGIKPGVIGSNKFDLEGPIVVANIQTLSKRALEVAGEFGLLIVDECHHTPASTFTKVVNISRAYYKIGLSGTLERKDGRHVVLTDFFSKKIYTPKRENMMVPDIYRIPVDIPFSDDSGTPWAHRVNALLYNPDYRNLVIQTAATQAARGHKVLVVADRVEFLEYCHEILEDNSVCVTGKVVEDEREALIARIFKDKDIIFGTTSIFSEGISVNCLSCLIPATPINNKSLLIQLIGRVVRVHENKLTPEVIDFILQGATAKRQSAGRMSVYIDEGYKISEILLK